MKESEISDFWQQNPFGASLVGDLTDSERQAYIEFFDRYDELRYITE